MLTSATNAISSRDLPLKSSNSNTYWQACCTMGLLPWSSTCTVAISSPKWLFVLKIMPDRANWFGYSIPVYSRRVAIWFRWTFRIAFSRCSMSLRGIFDIGRLRDVFLYKSSRTICSASGLSWRPWSNRTSWSAIVMAISACISCFLERMEESAMFVFLRCSQLTRSFSTYSRKYQVCKYETRIFV